MKMNLHSALLQYAGLRLHEYISFWEEKRFFSNWVVEILFSS